MCLYICVFVYTKRIYICKGKTTKGRQWDRRGAWTVATGNPSICAAPITTVTVTVTRHVALSLPPIPLSWLWPGAAATASDNNIQSRFVTTHPLPLSSAGVRVLVTSFYTLGPLRAAERDCRS